MEQQRGSVGFTARQACHLSGLRYDTLDHWDRTGFLKPSVERAAGKGSDRAYSFRDLVALRVACELRQAGISLQALRKVVVKLSGKGYLEPLAEAYLVSDGQDVYLKSGDEVLSLLRQPGQLSFAWFLDVGRIVEELREAIAA